MKRGGVVYIMASNNKRVLYTGVTSDLVIRVMQHKEKTFPKSFTSRYNCCILVYYRSFTTIEEAIMEEKRIKGGNRNAKEKLISQSNPEWKDLWDDIRNW
jgi:putative endonuclease